MQQPAPSARWFELTRVHAQPGSDRRSNIAHCDSELAKDENRERIRNLDDPGQQVLGVDLTMAEPSRLTR